MAAIIEVKDVYKTYSMGEIEVNALNGVSLTIQEKEFVAIVGASGSGKSTLMHMVGLLDQPTKGEVRLKGQNVSSLTEEELASLRNKYIGFVFQTFNLLPRTSSLENAYLPLIYSGTKRRAREDKAKKVLTKVGLGERLDHLPSQLSGGQQQRVAIARALINEPSIILADEPTGNLDSKSGEEVMEIFRDLNLNGNTIVLVTHELDIAKAAKRIVEIKDGKIIRDVKNGKHYKK